MRSSHEDILAAGWQIADQRRYSSNSGTTNYVWVFIKGDEIAGGQASSEHEALNIVRCQIGLPERLPAEEEGGSRD
jgi:hypothetical protein